MRVTDAVIVVGSVREAAALVGLPPDTVRDQLSNGRRVGRKAPGGRWVDIEVREDELIGDQEPVTADAREAREVDPARGRGDQVEALRAENARLTGIVQVQAEEIGYLREALQREQQIRMAESQARLKALESPTPPAGGFRWWWQKR